METLVDRLRIRAFIRRQIPGRKSVQEGASDRIADLLDEAADVLDPPFREGTLIYSETAVVFKPNANSTK